MTPEEQIADMERMTVEVMRVAQTALQIVITDHARDNEDAARRLVELLHSLSQMEVHCLVVILLAQVKATIEASCKLMIDFVAHMTGEPEPDWIAPAMNEAMAEFLRKGMDPDKPGVRQTMHDMFVRNYKGEE